MLRASETFDPRAEVIEVRRVPERMDPAVEREFGLAGERGDDTLPHLRERIGDRQAVVERLTRPDQPPVEKRPRREDSNRGQGGQGA